MTRTLVKFAFQVLITFLETTTTSLHSHTSWLNSAQQNPSDTAICWESTRRDWTSVINVVRGDRKRETYPLKSYKTC